MSSNDKKPSQRKGFEWRRRYKRQRSSIYFLPAKYTAILMLLLTAALSLVPYAGKLAWIVPFIFLFMESDSRFLAAVSAQTGLWTFFRSFVVLLMEIIHQVLQQRAYESRSESAIIAALTDTRWATVSTGVSIAYYLIMLLFLIFAWYYYLARIPGLAGLTDRLVDRLLPKGKG